MIRKPFLKTVFSAHRLLFIVLGSLLGLNFLLFFFLYLDVSPKLSQRERDLTTLQQQLRKGDVLGPQQVYGQGIKDWQLFQTLLPSVRHFSQLIGDLYSLANQCNLDISQISYTQKELPGAEILSYALRFSLVGTYDELKQFVYGLEESKRLIVIDKVTLNTAKGEEGAALVSLSLELTTYFAMEGLE